VNGDITTIGIPSQLQGAMPRLPSLVTDAGERATLRFLEFFTAAIRNKNTRRAYARAVTRFSDWCQNRQLTLNTLHPIVIGGYIEQLQTELSPPSVKQHLAAVRMLFDFLVVGQILPMNPASSVRGPKYSSKKGKTPVLTAVETRELLESIDTDTLVGLRDRALIGVMVFSFARIGATLDMDVEDYFVQGKHWWFRLHEKGGKRHEVVAHHNAEELMDAYLDAAGIRDDKHGPIFRSFSRRRQLTERRLHPNEALAMIKRRARVAGLPATICNHTFRATGITTYLECGGTLEKAQTIACHESPRTTKLYDRTGDEITLDEIERIVIFAQ
jgi:site-specific recombinase XerD